MEIWQHTEQSVTVEDFDLVESSERDALFSFDAFWYAPIINNIHIIFNTIMLYYIYIPLYIYIILYLIVTGKINAKRTGWRVWSGGSIDTT